ncbi:hypothetical protein HMI56_005890 [Coelomomyces lativittatus]|nr:hypothetical protein HMI56_005890 [Coelomomyces lativittatus]
MVSLLWSTVDSKFSENDEHQGTEKGKGKHQFDSTKDLFEAISFQDQKINFRGLRGKCPEVAKKYKLVYSLNFSLKRKDPTVYLYCEGRGRITNVKQRLSGLFLFLHSPPVAKEETMDSFSVIFNENWLPFEILGDYNNAILDVIIQCNSLRPICFKAELEVPSFALKMKVPKPQYTIFPFYYAMPMYCFIPYANFLF